MIYAVDFDGTLCRPSWPDIGAPNKFLIDFLRKERENGAEIILWTMREGEMLHQALAWCKEQGLEFDAVNDNAESQKQLWGNNPRKVYADCYLDDKNMDIRHFWCFTELWNDVKEGQHDAMRENL